MQRSECIALNAATILVVAFMLVVAHFAPVAVAGIGGGGGGFSDRTVYCTPDFNTGAQTGTGTVVNGNVYAGYVYRTPKTITETDTLTLKINVTTAAATITWAEAGLYYGDTDSDQNVSLTCVGFTDLSAIVNSTGIKEITISPSSGETIPAGEDVWVAIGCQSTTQLVVRAGNLEDQVRMATQVSDAQRPSTEIGTAAETFSWNNTQIWRAVYVPR